MIRAGQQSRHIHLKLCMLPDTRCAFKGNSAACSLSSAQPPHAERCNLMQTAKKKSLNFPLGTYSESKVTSCELWVTFMNTTYISVSKKSKMCTTELVFPPDIYAQLKVSRLHSDNYFIKVVLKDDAWLHVLVRCGINGINTHNKMYSKERGKTTLVISSVKDLVFTVKFFLRAMMEWALFLLFLCKTTFLWLFISS